MIANVNKFAFGTSIYCQRHMYVSDLMFLILLKLADGVKDSLTWELENRNTTYNIGLTDRVVGVSNTREILQGHRLIEKSLSAQA